MRRWLLLLLVLAMALSAYLASVAIAIHQESINDEAAPADLILVLGAAKYRGRPSPVYKARLDHAFDLHKRGLAPRILTTGGPGGDPIFTEGGVGRSYLISLGVPAEAIIVEQEGATTAQSIAAAAEIMRRMGLHSCIVVSDGYHIFRAKRMLASLGFRVFGSPRPDTRTGGLRQWWLYTRQALGYLLWRLRLSY